MLLDFQCWNPPAPDQKYSVVNEFKNDDWIVGALAKVIIVTTKKNFINNVCYSFDYNNLF